MERRVPGLTRARKLIRFEPKRTLQNVIDDILCDQSA